MNNKLVVVYQDCPTCGNRKEWGERTIAVARQSGLDIQYVSFATVEGQKLCKLAIYAGVGKLPFITNGKKFSDNIADFIEVEKADESQKTKKKRTRKTKKEVSDEQAE